MIRETFDLEGFTGVSLGFNGDVYLSQGSQYSVVVEGQKNVIDNIKRTIKSGTWYIDFEQSVRNSKPVKVYITMPTLDRATVSGSGNLITETEFTGLDGVQASVSGSGNLKLHVNAEEIDGAISGSGKIGLKGNAGDVDMSISGSGDINAEDLMAQNFDISISGSGNARVNVSGDLDASISGSGDIRYRGDNPNVKARVSGSGDVRRMD